MITSPTLVVFVLASYALALVPGPAVIYIVNRSLAQGPRAGVVSALGIATGGLVHVAAAALGMSALLASSAVAFSIVKYAGAAYLVYLGIRALRNGDLPLDEAVPMLGARRVFGQGVVVNVLNPKTALFFLSFFPQFVHPERGSVPLQMALLGVVFITAAFSSDLVYALSAAGLRRIVLRSPRVRRSHRYVSASIFLGLGVAAATAE